MQRFSRIYRSPSLTFLGVSNVSEGKSLPPRMIQASPLLRLAGSRGEWLPSQHSAGLGWVSNNPPPAPIPKRSRLKHSRTTANRRASGLILLQ